MRALRFLCHHDFLHTQGKFVFCRLQLSDEAQGVAGALRRKYFQQLNTMYHQRSTLITELIAALLPTDTALAARTRSQAGQEETTAAATAGAGAGAAQSAGASSSSTAAAAAGGGGGGGAAGAIANLRSAAGGECAAAAADRLRANLAQEQQLYAELDDIVFNKLFSPLQVRAFRILVTFTAIASD